MSGLTLEQTQQVTHLSRLALLGMIARGVAQAEFESSPDVTELCISIERPPAGMGCEIACELTFISGPDVQGAIAL